MPPPFSLQSVRAGSCTEHWVPRATFGGEVSRVCRPLRRPRAARSHGGDACAGRSGPRRGRRRAGGRVQFPAAVRARRISHSAYLGCYAFAPTPAPGHAWPPGPCAASLEVLPLVRSSLHRVEVSVQPRNALPPCARCLGAGFTREGYLATLPARSAVAGAITCATPCSPKTGAHDGKSRDDGSPRQRDAPAAAMIGTWGLFRLCSRFRSPPKRPGSSREWC